MFKLITSQDIKQLTKGDFGAEFDFLLDDILIPAVGRSFAHYCGRPDFDKAARVEYLSPRSYPRLLFISSPPIASSPAVELWQNSATPRAYEAADKLVNGEDYFVHEAEGMIEHASYFLGGVKTIKVSYTGGLISDDASEVPEDLRLAAIIQVKAIFDRREELSLSGRSLEGGSISMLSPLVLSKQVTMLLDPYRVMRI